MTKVTAIFKLPIGHKSAWRCPARYSRPGFALPPSRASVVLRGTRRDKRLGGLIKDFYMKKPSYRYARNCKELSAKDGEVLIRSEVNLPLV
jgi:hypothetical protein